jgi:hypothetical protein
MEENAGTVMLHVSFLYKVNSSSSKTQRNPEHLQHIKSTVFWITACVISRKIGFGFVLRNQA